MLNVPTLWTAFVVNFLALGLIWAYVMRATLPSRRRGSGPDRLCGGDRCCGGDAADGYGFAGAAVDRGHHAGFRRLRGGEGIKEFYNEPVKWRGTALITGLMFAGTALFLFGYDSETMRS